MGSGDVLSSRNVVLTAVALCVSRGFPRGAWKFGELFQALFRSLLPRSLSPLHDVSQFVCFVFLETKLFNKVYFTKHYFHVTFQGKFSFQHHFLIFPSSFKLNKLIAVQASVPKSARNILRPRGGGCPFCARGW